MFVNLIQQVAAQGCAVIRECDYIKCMERYQLADGVEIEQRVYCPDDTHEILTVKV